MICVRPGHLPPPEAIEIVDKWLEADMDWGSPAAVVLTRARIRVRRELPL